jgi:uncharacterized membrane protein
MSDPMQTPPTPQAQPAGLTENSTCGLAYLTFIPAVIFLATAPYNQSPKVRFHCWQSIFLFIAAVVVSLVLNLFSPIFGFYLIHFILDPLVSLGFFLLWLLVMINAFQGKTFKVPFVSDLAAKQAGTTV